MGPYWLEIGLWHLKGGHNGAGEGESEGTESSMEFSSCCSPGVLPSVRDASKHAASCSELQHGFC